MEHSMPDSVRYNPRTGEFEGIDAVPPPRRRTRSAGNGSRTDRSGCLTLLAWFLVGVAIVHFWNHWNKRKAHSDNTPKTTTQQVQKPQARTESSRQSPGTTRQQAKAVLQDVRPVCRRCGGIGRVCAMCEGYGYVLRKCKECQGSGKKDEIAQAGKAVGKVVGNIIALPIVAVGEMFGAKTELNTKVDAKCPYCKGVGGFSYDCKHEHGSIACPDCSH